LRLLSNPLVVPEVRLDLVTVVEVVGQGGMHVRQRDAREHDHDLVWRVATHFMPDNDVHDANAVSGDARPTAADPRRFLDVLPNHRFHSPLPSLTLPSVILSRGGRQSNPNFCNGLLLAAPAHFGFSPSGTRCTPRRSSSAPLSRSPSGRSTSRC